MIKRFLNFFLWASVAIALILLLAVIRDEDTEYWMKEILGVESKWEVIKFVSWSIAGILAFWGLVVVSRWVTLQVRISDAQVKSSRIKKIK